jgi:hypothetical protein
MQWDNMGMLLGVNPDPAHLALRCGTRGLPVGSSAPNAESLHLVSGMAPVGAHRLDHRRVFLNTIRRRGILPPRPCVGGRVRCARPVERRRGRPGVWFYGGPCPPGNSPPLSGGTNNAITSPQHLGQPVRV